MFNVGDIVRISPKYAGKEFRNKLGTVISGLTYSGGFVCTVAFDGLPPVLLNCFELERVSPRVVEEEL